MTRPTFIAIVSIVALAAAALSPIGRKRERATTLVTTKRSSPFVPPATGTAISVPSRHEKHIDLPRALGPMRPVNGPRGAIASETSKTMPLAPPVFEAHAVDTPPNPASPYVQTASIAPENRPLELTGRTGRGTWVVHGGRTTVTCRFNFGGRVAWRGPTETAFGGWSQNGVAVTLQAGPTSAVGTLDGNRLVLRCHTVGAGDSIATLMFDE